MRAQVAGVVEAADSSAADPLLQTVYLKTAVRAEGKNLFRVAACLGNRKSTARVIENCWKHLRLVALDVEFHAEVPWSDVLLENGVNVQHRHLNRVPVPSSGRIW